MISKTTALRKVAQRWQTSQTVDRSRRSIRLAYTDKLQAEGAEGEDYRSWTNHVYQQVVGMTADGIRERAGVGEDANARSLLSPAELAAVLRVEATVAKAKGKLLKGVHTRAIQRHAPTKETID